VDEHTALTCTTAIVAAIQDNTAALHAIAEALAGRQDKTE
jgi:hypothetical protein